MSSTRYLICIALCACTVACLITAGCSAPSGQPEIGSDLSGDLVVHFIDVGQGGDSILVEFRDKTMLIDAGERGMGGERVIAYLEERNVERIDVVVATHAHTDHIGGLADVISAYPVGRFVDAAQPHPTATYENLLAGRRPGDTLHRSGARADGCPRSRPRDPDPEPGRGADRRGQPGLGRPEGHLQRDLLPLHGRCEKPAEKSMMEAGLDLDADVLKVGHHASRYASSAEFLSAVSPPAISVISVGAGNDYGHPPHEEAVERIEATGSRIYRTDLDGTVIVATDGTALTVAAGEAPAATV
ncbi:MBL fold metallo-hydrolase, partial [Methanoculleus chikugoensis]|uniref:ComEC/Rec2 family competence protein n=1 Tax=Methanoculleus chikugoensis TaxID=118126 RepID=UPI000ACBC967